MSNFSTKLASSVSILALLAASTSASLVSAASEFVTYAQVLADNGVITAQSTEAGFRLGNNITRAELSKVVANLGAYTPTECAGDVYSDVGSKLGDLCGYVEALADAGVVSTSSATFRPSANVTRAEMVKMLLGALGETPSDVSAGYMDLGGLGDLAGYVNRANEIGCAADASYFRPNATASRGEAFKIAACAAQLDNVSPTPGPGPTPTPTPGTGGTTTTGSTVAGALTVALDGTAMAQYVPKNGSSIKVGSVKLSATAGDVTVRSLTIVRSGLGNAADIMPTNGIRAAMSGVVISSSADYYNATSQKGTVYFSPSLVVKAGSSTVVDILVNLSGAENSQHQFTLDSVNAGSTVTGTPITLGLLNTTSYVTTTTTASLSSVGGNVTPGKIQQLVAKVDISAGGRDTKVVGFTLTRSGSTDFTKRLANVMVYRNGVTVGTTMVTGEKLSVMGLSDVLTAGNTQTYEIKADVLVDSTSTVLAYKFDTTTDVTANELATGYATQVSLGTSTQAINFNSVEVTFEKTSTGTQTIAPGANNVKLFSAKLSSSVPLSVRAITITPTLSGMPSSSTSCSGTCGGGTTSSAVTYAGNQRTTANLTASGGTQTIVDYPASVAHMAFVNDQLSVKLNGAEIATLTSVNGAQLKTVSFVVDSANPAIVTIDGSVKNNASVAGSYQFNVSLTDVRDSSNNAATVGAGGSLTGDKTTIATTQVDVKAATVAPATTSRVYGNSTQEIGRFAITARNEAARVQTIVLTGLVGTGTAPAVTATLQSIANSTSSIKLVDVATLTQISATAQISGNTITFSSMNDVVGKDITRNYKVMLDVSSLDVYYGQTIMLSNSPLVTAVRDSNSTAITPGTTATNMKTYSLGIVPPTVTVMPIVSLDKSKYLAKIKVTNTDSNTGLTLSGVTVEFNYRYSGAGTAPSFSGTLCLRDEGSNNACGMAGTTTGYAATQAGLTRTFVPVELAMLTSASTLIDKNGQFVTFEVYLDNAPVWITGDNVSVAVRSVDYVVGGANSTESYVGVTGASATATK